MPSGPDLTCGTSLQTSRMISVGQFLEEMVWGNSEPEQQALRHSDSHQPFLPNPCILSFSPSKDSFPSFPHPPNPSAFCSHPKFLLSCPGLHQAVSPHTPALMLWVNAHRISCASSTHFQCSTGRSFSCSTVSSCCRPAFSAGPPMERRDG